MTAPGGSSVGGRPRRRRTGFDQAPDATTTAAAAMTLVQNLASAAEGMDMQGRIMAQQQATKQLTALQATGVNVQATRHARRVYVGGFPPDTDESTLAAFMTRAMEATGATNFIGSTTTQDAVAGAGGGGGAAIPQQPVVSCVLSTYINREKQFAFVEFRTVEEASNCLALDGIIFAGAALRVRRPNDYNVCQAALLGPTTPNHNLNLAAVGLSGPVPGAGGGGGGAGGGGAAGSILPTTENNNSPFKLFVGGLPLYLTDDQVRELVSSFGQLRAFNVVRDKVTGLSKGYGFFEYADHAVTETAINGLNGMRLGDKMITVKLASGSNTSSVAGAAGVGGGGAGVFGYLTAAAGNNNSGGGGGSVVGVTISAAAPPGAATAEETTIMTPTPYVRLQGMVTRDELLDPQEAREILEDTEEECRGFGSLIRVLMPLPLPSSSSTEGGTAAAAGGGGGGGGGGEETDPPGVGEVLLHFADVDSARRAQRSLNRRKFADRLVAAVFVSEAEFKAIEDASTAGTLPAAAEGAAMVEGEMAEEA